MIIVLIINKKNPSMRFTSDNEPIFKAETILGEITFSD
ncbi:hypothetical protein ADIWIN_1133 [Winogradskyella psychrotolerans RS-3]|uniref:Uncharacterized protein n=1 Tax=Winogradskyella psychrotolerans RS-3 TaxID=641526 RepID=S7XCQ6_9FLAO|nr:hypothetical protein ADIWIN_1133 [Winogradskyella psychrotolerans RS-3]